MATLDNPASRNPDQLHGVPLVGGGRGAGVRGAPSAQIDGESAQTQRRVLFAHCSRMNKTDPNPKTNPTGNAVKDPSEWTTGDEPMTGAQASYLKTLSEESGEAFDKSLTKAEASVKIDELREQAGKEG